MKIKVAVITDLYPPAYIGGYEIGMSWIVDNLRQRGAHVDVFHCREFSHIDNLDCKTYTHPKAGFNNFDIGPGIGGSVELYLRAYPSRIPWFLVSHLKSIRNYFAFKRKLASSNYDLILAGNPFGLLTPIYDAASATARAGNTKFSLLVSDNWVLAWPTSVSLIRILTAVALAPDVPSKRRKMSVQVLRNRVQRKLVRKASATFTRVEDWFLNSVVCVSKYIESITKDKVSAGSRIEVAYWGLPMKELPVIETLPDFTKSAFKIAYVGRIVPEKGVMTLLKSMSLTRSSHTLTVIGDDTTEYGISCKHYVQTSGLESRVKFTGKLTQSQVNNSLSQFQILVVPSEYEEPYAIVPVLGKYFGLVTIVSDTGGSGEGIDTGKDGFLFEKANVAELAGLIDQLDDNRNLCERVSKEARRRVVEEGNISHMVDRILNTVALSRRL